MHTLRRIIILAIIGFIAIGATQAQKIQFRHLKEGLSNTYVSKVYQDHFGYIWVATQSGLNRYDGLEFTNFEHDENDPTKLPSNRVLAILEDSKQRLWFACNVGGLAQYNYENNSFTTYKNTADTTSISSDRLTAIFEDKDQYIWVGTEDGINRFDPEKRTFERFPTAGEDMNSPYPSSITSIIQDKKGIIWIATRFGLNTFDPKTNTFSRILPKQYQPEGETIFEFHELIEDREGTIWLGSLTHGIVCIKQNKDSLSFSNLVHNPNDPTSLSHNRILSLLEDLNGNIWVGTENGGLCIYNPATKTFTRYQNSLADDKSIADNSIWDIFQDNNERIWLSTFSQGLEIADPFAHKFEHIFQNPNNLGLNYKTTTSFLEVDGKIWIGTDGGGINIWDRSSNTYDYLKHDPKAASSLGSDAVLRLFEDSRSDIWVATWAGGVNKYDKKSKSFKRYLPKKDDTTSISSPHVFDIAEDSKGNLWFATFQGGLSMLDRKTDSFRNLEYVATDTNTLSIDNIMSLCIDQGDTIWAGTTRGVNRIWLDKNNKPTVERLNAQNIPKIVQHKGAESIFRDSKNRLWLSFADGLFLYTEGKYSRLDKKYNLGSTYYNGVIEDSDGNIWLSGNKGISQLSFITSDSIAVKTYGKSDGIYSNSFTRHSFYKTKNNEIFFGGDNGFNHFFTNKIVGNPYPPQIALTDFKLFNKSLTIGQENSILNKSIELSNEVTLNYKQNIFTLEFIALGYTNSYKNQYAYKLEGLEHLWNYSGTKHSATYTNLDAGTYTFRLKAANSDGVWAEDKTPLKIIITPPFWETWWFRVFVTLSILSASIGFYVSRINKIKRQKKELELTVQERTKDLQIANISLSNSREEILQQNEEIQSINDSLESKNNTLSQQNDQISKQHNDLEKKNTIITSSINYAKKIQNSILPLKKNIDSVLEHFVYFAPRDIVSGDFYWFAHENKGMANEQIFIATVDCTGHGIPGAFMSMIGSTLLNDIIRVGKESDPGHILKLLDLRISAALKQEQTENRDGMDVCLCRIEYDPKTKKPSVFFAGAKRPLFYSHNKNEIERLNGDKTSIGGKHRLAISFTTHQLKLEKGDILYLTSDGYIDQNNPDRKRLGTMEFMSILNELKKLDLNEQADILDQSLKQYRQTEEQRDDIVILGVRL